MTDWQPIETIPKGDNGKGPLVFVWIPDKGYPWVARWVDEDYEWGRPSKGEICSTYSECMAEADGYWHVQLDGHPKPQYNPTHWMPLMPGPSKEAE